MSDTESDVPVDVSIVRSSANKKNKNTEKVPRGVRKAKREKSKRDNINSLFTDMGKLLEPDSLNKGKYCTLNDCIKLLRDLLGQVDSLKSENATLLSEYQYVNIEKNELKEETSALGLEVEKLQSDVEIRIRTDSSPDFGSYVLPEPAIKRPHARYASSLDSWPSQILSEQTK